MGLLQSVKVPSAQLPTTLGVSPGSPVGPLGPGGPLLQQEELDEDEEQDDEEEDDEQDDEL